jgi:inhibitor of KinA sporulation pathway (predicted exonuclease)
MIKLSLDLELNNDEKNTILMEIIQVGYTFYDTESKEFFTYGDYVKIDAPLTPYIIKLTGITQDELDTRGVTLEQAYSNLVARCAQHGYTKGSVITWGGGDMQELKAALQNPKWIFGRRERDVKQVYIMVKEALGINLKRGGLKSSCQDFGVGWTPYKDEVAPGKIRQRTAHDARCDALNTMIIHNKLIEIMKGSNE